MKLIKSLLLTSILAAPIAFPTNVFAEEQIQVFIDKQKINFVVDPVIQDGTTLVQFRTIFEKLGYSVEWNQEIRSVTASKKDLSIVLYIDSKKALVNSKEVLLEKAPTIIKGGTMVPLRFVSETSGKKVNWKAETRTIEIGDKANSTTGIKEGTTTTNTQESTSTNTQESIRTEEYKKLPVTIVKSNYTVTINSIKRLAWTNKADVKNLISVTIKKNNDYPTQLVNEGNAFLTDGLGDIYPFGTPYGWDKTYKFDDNYHTEREWTVELPYRSVIEDGTKNISLALKVNTSLYDVSKSESQSFWDIEERDYPNSDRYGRGRVLLFDIDTTDLFK